MDRFAGMHQDFAEGVGRTIEKAEKSSGIDFSAVDWKRSDGVLDLNAGVGSDKLVGKFNFVGGLTSELLWAIATKGKNNKSADVRRMDIRPAFRNCSMLR
jgi:hypothetical protein